MHQSNNANKDNINQICTDIGSLFISAAEVTSETSNNIPPKYISENDKDQKPWFGYKCKNARRKYHIARKINNTYPSINNKSNLKEASKNYKRTMNFHINKYNQNMQNKLRKLKSTNPKDYWKIMNSINKNKDNDSIDIETLYNFFKNLNEQGHDANDDVNINIDTTDDEELLNSFITEAEILKCIKQLKNNKSSANDKIINEYIKNTTDIMFPTYVAFFILVFDCGIIPDSWLEGIIRPIYKNNGDAKNPENYRPITILSCFGKLFTAVLNNRLTDFLDQTDILKENQAGFRAGYSTLDHIFTLHSLIEILKFKKIKLYCSFVDFSKAFDSVWRGGLWMKLLGNSINGKIFQVIHNLYQNIKSCVMYSGDQSNFFQSFWGVRQFENLSPVLFSLFLNDMEDFLETHHCNGINFDFANDQLVLYLKVFVLLYADDTVIFGTDPDSFQNNLNVFYEYCKLWKLNINYKKTKIMIFGRRNYNGLEFKLGEHTIMICDEFKYLGVVFSKNRSFYKAIKHNIDHAKKAMHLLYKRIRNLNIPLDLQIELFDHTILPILLYGCEIWGYQNTKLIENVKNQFLRSITKLKKSTPIYMLYAELGITPLNVLIKSRMIGFWLKLLNSEDIKLSKTMYNVMQSELHLNPQYKWLNFIKSILTSVGKPALFNESSIANPEIVKNQIIQTLNDLNAQEWQSKTTESSKGKNYKLYKEDQQFEAYLRILPRKAYAPLIKFRTGNHRLPIETGRWEGIPYTERKCNLCESNDIGDEFHFLLICPTFATERKSLLKPYYFRRPNIIKYKELLNTRNKKVLLNLAKFVKSIMNRF